MILHIIVAILYLISIQLLFFFCVAVFVSDFPGLKEKPEQNFHQILDMWPSEDLVRKMNFDYLLHDPKYEDASIISSDFPNPSTEGKIIYFLFMGLLHKKIP